MTASLGIRKRTKQAKYRAAFPVPDGVDPEIVAKCVPLWRECAKRANSRYGGEKPGNNKGRSSALYSPDDVLRKHGIEFLRDPERWGAYEKAVRRAAQGST